MTNTYCNICKCWHRPDGTTAEGIEEELSPMPKLKIKRKSVEESTDIYK
jgi:hypothetical protein